MKVIVKEACGGPVELQISNDLKTLQEIVGGYIETIGIEHDIVLICNEDGKRIGLPRNIQLPDEQGIVLDVVCGTVIATGVDEDDFASLTDAQAEFITEWLNKKAVRKV